jgi:hypothetical protein
MREYYSVGVNVAALRIQFTPLRYRILQYGERRWIGSNGRFAKKESYLSPAQAY